MPAFFHAFEAAFTTTCLGRQGAVFVAADERFETANFFLLGLILLPHQLHFFGFELLELDVSARVIAVESAKGNLECAIGHPVEEVAIVRDDNQGAVPAFEELLEPLEGGQVEVVGRLVEEQDIGTRQQDGRQRGAGLHATRKLRQTLWTVIGRVKAQAGQHPLDGAFDVIATRMFEARQQFAVAVHPVGPVGMIGVCDVVFEGGDFALHGMQGDECFVEQTTQGLGIVEAGLLGQI